MTNDDLLRDPLIGDALDRYVSSDPWPDDWAAISARAERRRPRGVSVIGGAAVIVACAAMAVMTVVFVRDGGVSTAADTSVPLTENPFADLGGARTSAVVLRVIRPGEHDPSGNGECYVRLEVHGVPRGDVCTTRAAVDKSGMVARTRDHGTGLVTVYGILPASADGVRIPDDPPIEIDGRLFSAEVGATAPAGVEFTSRGAVIPARAGDDGPAPIVP